VAQKCNCQFFPRWYLLLDSSKPLANPLLLEHQEALSVLHLQRDEASHHLVEQSSMGRGRNFAGKEAILPLAMLRARGRIGSAIRHSAL